MARAISAAITAARGWARAYGPAGRCGRAAGARYRRGARGRCGQTGRGWKSSRKDERGADEAGTNDWSADRGGDTRRRSARKRSGRCSARRSGPPRARARHRPADRLAMPRAAPWRSRFCRRRYRRRFLGCDTGHLAGCRATHRQPSLLQPIPCQPILSQRLSRQPRPCSSRL